MGFNLGFYTIRNKDINLSKLIKDYSNTEFRILTNERKYITISMSGKNEGCEIILGPKVDKEKIWNQKASVEVDIDGNGLSWFIFHLYLYLQIGLEPLEVGWVGAKNDDELKITKIQANEIETIDDIKTRVSEIFRDFGHDPDSSLIDHCISLVIK